MVAVTLVAGAAVFSWINGQAGTSESAYGQSVASNINFLKEHFTVVTESFALTGASCSGGPPAQCNQMSFWVYNSGQVTFTLASVRVQSQSATYPLNILFYPAVSSACTATTTQACGFVDYNPTTGAVVCSDTAAFAPSPTDQPGFYENNAIPVSLAEGSLTSNPYQVTMPTAATCAAGGNLYLYDGVTYSLTFTGLYGNTFSTSVTANG